MPSGNRKVRLSSHEANDDDEFLGALHYRALQRGGDTSMLHKTDPERILIERENRADEAKVRAKEKAAAKRLCKCIRFKLSPRQQIIWALHAEGIPFSEIALGLGCSVRTVYYDWSVIRKVARECRRIPITG